ncbi:MAG TPA: hypothetical protein VFO60_01205, partial [Candidatus Dormibacteraeota bacterium]|nr:hypothetical protein [Candidatus Dormibacteraeota bacterium]
MLIGNVLAWIRRHPAVGVLSAAAVVGLAVLVVAALGSRTPGGCASAAPVPDLPAQLRSIGGFDQPVPANDLRAVRELAMRAASALHADLAVTAVGDPVAVAAADPAVSPGIVVPLLTNPGPDGRYRTVEGLVAFLEGCGGQVYYHAVADLASAPPATFPQLSQDDAARRLGGDVTLVYTSTPFAPAWRRTGGTGCVAATAAPVTGCTT